MAFSHVNYAASYFINVYDFKTKKWINYSAENLYYHGSFPRIPVDANHCESFIFEKQKEDFYVSIEALQKNDKCSVHLIINVKNINAFVDFDIGMGDNNIYDVFKLDEQGTRWFYGKKTLNNRCSINLLVDQKPYV